MALNSRNSLYPFSEVFRVTSEGTTSIDLWSIPAGTIIDHVMVVIYQAAVDAGGSNLQVGDDDSATGFITAADATAAAGTVYGDVPSERGTYLYDGTVRGGYRKYYATAGKEIKFSCSAAIDTEGIYDVIVTGYRL